jgi:hypothetical protein
MLWAIATATLGALAVALYAPPLAALFRFAAPAPADLALALGAGIASVGWIELLKRPWRGGVSAAGSAG